MKLYNKWILSAIVLAFSAVFLFSAGMAGAAIDGGYVGSDACGVCHTAIKADFDKSGHPYKVRTTYGLTPVMSGGDNVTTITDPLSFQAPTPPLANINTFVAGPPQVGKNFLTGYTGGDPLDWSSIAYVIGGYGWKTRFGILDENAGTPGLGGDTVNDTGYVWTGNTQFNMFTGGWVGYNGGKNKKYECAICHNTNGTVFTDGYSCEDNTARTLPWANFPDLSATTNDNGGFYSQWTFDGVQCEACHGPGETHAGSLSKSDIVKNTSKDVCGKCHVRASNTTGQNDECGGTGAILTNGAQNNGGDTLANQTVQHHEQYNELVGYKVEDNAATGGDDDGICEAGETCKQDGAHASLDCVTCHDPHKRAHKVPTSTETALGLTDNSQSAEARGAVVACTNCHYGKTSAKAAGGLYSAASHGTLACIDCHMAETMKSASATVGSWGVKADVKGHIFAIDPAATTMSRDNTDGKHIATKAMTVNFACGKCHDSAVGTAPTLTVDNARTAATNYHTAIASIDNGYVGSAVCGSCHSSHKADFDQTGHPYKLRFTLGATPTSGTDPLSALLPTPTITNISTLTNNALATDANLDGKLDWSAISYVIGGYGWKGRFGILDDTDADGDGIDDTGYVWTGTTQYNMMAADTTLDPTGVREDWSGYNGGKDKKYECSTCHSTNGRILTSGYDCATPTTYVAGVNVPEPWASTGLDTSNHGGFYSEWSLSGVQCEACHGAGLNHATAASSSNITVNTSKAVCGACHQRAENTTMSGTVGNAECGGPNAGSHINEYLANGAVASGSWISHHEQYNEMVGLDDGAHKTLDCVTCHNPHKRAHKVTDAIAGALGITDNDQSAEARGAVVSCESCHASTAPLAAAGGADTKITATAHSSAAGCVDCHMGEATKSATAESGTWGKKADVKTHIFTIDTTATLITRTNGSKTVATNYLTVDYACGKCHDISMSDAVNVTFSKETAQVYASVMHGGAATGGPVSPDPVAEPDSCDPLVLAATFGCAEVGGIETCNLGNPGHVNLNTTGTTSGADITVWWGDGSGLNEPSATEHTYTKIGKNQVIVTAANACGEKAQEVMIVNVSGGVGGKGTLTIAASGTDGRKVSYSVLNGSNVSITNGNITLDGSKSITLDAAANYSVKIGYEAVQPYTDPVTYRSCDLVGTEIGKCSHPAYANQTSCEAAGKEWQITGQLITPVAVSTGATTTVSLTGCN